MRIIFLPGASGDGRFWKPVADRLDMAAEKVLIDWPGLGNVPRSPRVNAFSDFVDLVVEQLRGPTDLVAQSMGGVVAIAVALKHPELVRRLVLTATSGGIDVARFHQADWREDYRRRFPNAAEYITVPRVGRLDDGELRKIQAPALLLWGDEDPIAPVALGKHFASLLPEAELVIVKGGDHSFAALRPDDVAPHVARHLGL